MSPAVLVGLIGYIASIIESGASVPAVLGDVAVAVLNAVPSSAWPEIEKSVLDGGREVVTFVWDCLKSGKPFAGGTTTDEARAQKAAELAAAGAAEPEN